MKFLRMTVGLNLLAAAAAMAAPPPATLHPAPKPAALTAFWAECTHRAAAAEKAGTITVQGRDGWLFFGPELRHESVGAFWGPFAAAVSKATNPAYADPLPAILDFKRQLDKAGIQLLFVPVPPKVVVYPDKLGSKTSLAPLPRLDIHDQDFYDLLRLNGVNVVDLAPDLIAHRQDPEGPTYCKTDTHWSGRACVLAAHRLAGILKTQHWFKQGPAHLSQQWKNVEIDGDLRQALDAANQAKLPKETLPLHFVGRAGGADLTPVEPDPSSPVVFLGDSHDLIFHSGGDMLAQGAGLADQLALEMGFPVDLVAVKGSGATPARINLLRHARANPAYLPGKKVVIWCFTAREFTESMGWQKVPVVR